MRVLEKDWINSKEFSHMLDVKYKKPILMMKEELMMTFVFWFNHWKNRVSTYLDEEDLRLRGRGGQGFLFL